MRRRAASTLLIARAVYAFSWYNVGAVLPLIGSGLRASTTDLGIVLGAFLVGAAAFQIPAGLAALRWGNRNVSLTALAVMGAFALASGFSPNWIVLAVLRFGTGVGAAFFFAPALGLIASFYPAGSRGPVIGFYNAGFSVGAGLGTIGGAIVGVALGWSWALAIGGFGLLAIAAVATTVVPAPGPKFVSGASAAAPRAGLSVLRTRTVWAIALGTAGLWASSYILAQYTVEYAAAVHPAWSVTLAATLPTALILIEIVGAPIGGWLAERSRNMRDLLLLYGAPAGVAVLLIPFLPFVGLAAVFLFFGFVTGIVFADLYLMPSYLPGVERESLSLALALMNGIQIFLGSALAILFAFVAAGFGYTIAWFYAGLVALAPLPLLFAVTGARREPGVRVSATLPSPDRPA